MEQTQKIGWDVCGLADLLPLSRKLDSLGFFASSS
jgi:hypothetical protein